MHRCNINRMHFRTLCCLCADLIHKRCLHSLSGKCISRNLSYSLLIFENTIGVGDIVEIGGWRGRVTDMGIRTTEITNDSNDVKIITNSRIGDVINLSRTKTACTEEFVLPRTVEVAELPNLVASYIEAICEKLPEIDESLELDEITKITEDSYTVRLSYLVNEADRESVTIRLRNEMLLLLEAEKNSALQEEETPE